MSKPLRVGVIGAGANTVGRHIPGLQKIEGVTVTHVANRSLESSKKAAEACNIPNACNSWQELVASPDIDAVCIGTWPYTHAEMTIAALEAGKHVLCEARMAANAGEARAMAACAKAHPNQIAQIVPSPLTLKWDKTVAGIIQRGEIGSVVALEVNGIGSSFADFRDRPPHWREQRKFSGNNIMTMGIFYEAILRWVGEAKTVMAMGKVNVSRRQGEEITVPDHIDILAHMACGAQMHMQFSAVTGLAGGGELGAQFWIHGTEGTLHIDMGDRSGSGLRMGKKGSKTLEEVKVEREPAGRWRVEEEFVGATRGTEQIRLTDFPTGVRYMAFTDAVAQSLEEKRAVTLTTDFSAEATNIAKL